MCFFSNKNAGQSMQPADRSENHLYINMYTKIIMHRGISMYILYTKTHRERAVTMTRVSRFLFYKKVDIYAQYT